MILRFKPGSDAEKAAKELNANRDKTLEYAKDIVEKVTGIRPTGFGYRWFFGISYSWDCYSTGFDSSVSNEIEGMRFLRELKGIKYFEPNKRNKKGKEIANTFSNEQNELRTDSEPMEKFGIFTNVEYSFTDWHIGEDEKGVWMAISPTAFEWLKPHPDVFLETTIQTTSPTA